MQLRRNEILTGLLVLATVVVAHGHSDFARRARPFQTARHLQDLSRQRSRHQARRTRLARGPEDRAGRAAEFARHPGRSPTRTSHRRCDPPAGSGCHAQRPVSNRPKYEVRIDVRVDKDAGVYKDAQARLITLGLLGETAIDFTAGNETSGRAEDGQTFAGDRVPDFGESIARMLEIVQPVAIEAQATLKELQTTAQNLSRITDEQSQLNMTLVQMRTFAENLTNMTASNSPLQLALKNVETITTNVDKLTTDLSSNDNISVTLQNFRDSSNKLKSLMNDLGPDLKATGANVKDLTETVKTQPWRLVWPSTKKYPEDQPAASDTITVRKTTRAQRPTPSPTPRRRNAAVP